MDIHKPHPFHGWREFLKEYGIIVLGVLTALLFEQAVEALHWRHAVAAQREALYGEISQRLNTPSARLAQEICVQGRLKDLQVLFLRHKRGEPLGLVGPMGRPAVLGNDEGVWTTAAGSQTLEHMPLDERERLGAAFSSFASLDAVLSQEQRAWDELGRLDHAELLEDGDWPALRDAYARVITWDSRGPSLAAWTLKNASLGRRANQPMSLADLVKQTPSVRALCQPLLTSGR